MPRFFLHPLMRRSSAGHQLWRRMTNCDGHEGQLPRNYGRNLVESSWLFIGRETLYKSQTRQQQSLSYLCAEKSVASLPLSGCAAIASARRPSVALCSGCLFGCSSSVPSAAYRPFLRGETCVSCRSVHRWVQNGSPELLACSCVAHASAARLSFGLWLQAVLATA